MSGKTLGRIALSLLVIALCYGLWWLAGHGKIPFLEKLPDISKIFFPRSQQQKSEQKPERLEPVKPDDFNFFTYKVALKSGKEIAAREVKRDDQLVKIVTSAGLYMEIPLDDVDYIRKLNKQ